LGEIADALKRAKSEAPERPAPARPAADRASSLPDPRAGSIAAQVMPDAQARRDWEVAGPFGDEPGRELRALALALPRARVQPGADPAASSDIPGGEAARHLALRLHGELERRGVRSLAVASALRNEGKTTVSCHLALALATLTRGRGVALVDLDLRKPSVASALGVTPKVGIEAVLAGEASLAECGVAIEAPKIDVFAALDPRRAAHDLLIQPSLSEIVRELEARYSVVIFDTPPTLLVPDTRLILRQVPVVVPVGRAGATRMRSFQQMIEMLPRDQVLGAVINGDRPQRHGSDYYYYGDRDRDAS